MTNGKPVSLYLINNFFNSLKYTSLFARRICMKIICGLLWIRFLDYYWKLLPSYWLLLLLLLYLCLIFVYNQSKNIVGQLRKLSQYQKQRL